MSKARGISELVIPWQSRNHCGSGVLVWEQKSQLSEQVKDMTRTFWVSMCHVTTTMHEEGQCWGLCPTLTVAVV
jgi:hypothetical protein